MNGGIELGTGILTWFADERRTDRYGYVWLMPDGHTSLTARQPVPVPLQNLDRCTGTGRLVAEVVEARESTHLGDFAHRVYPRRTPAGTRVELGTGSFHSVADTESGIVHVGLKPLDGRADKWLSMRALYDVHEHMVRLWFEPEERAFHE